MSLKNARSHSTDPVQEHLRQRKEDWNESCREFIARINAFKPHLISFKRGLNGRGDPKASIPISSIKDPLPTKLQSYLGSVNSEMEGLASSFDRLLSEAQGIMSEQTMYASKRKKSTKPRVAGEISEMMTVEGSSGLSRFWANFLSKSDQITLDRLSMLDSVHQLFKDLVEFEDMVLEKGSSNIEQMINTYYVIDKKIKSIIYSFKSLVFSKIKDTTALQSHESDIDQKPFSQQSNIDQLPKDENTNNEISNNINPSIYQIEEDTPLEDIRGNILKMLSSKIVKKPDVDGLLTLLNAIEFEKDENKRNLRIDRLKLNYNKLIKNIINNVEINNTTLPKSAGIKNTLKYYTHLVGGKDATTAARVSLFKSLRKAKRDTDKLMDLLENKKIDVEKIRLALEDVEKEIINMGDYVHGLNNLYGYNSYKDPNKSEQLNPAKRSLTRQIRRDIDKPVW